MQPLNIGLTDTQRQGVIDLLNSDLADSYLLLVKTKKISLGCCGTTIHDFA
jgi:starvation-inducible DNA-binding protein